MQTQGWHTANWGFLGWLETGFKLAALVVGFIAFAQAGSGDLMLANHPRIVAVIVFALLTLVWIGTLVLRFQQREIISMIFGIVQALGHIALLVAILRAPTQNTLPAIFGVLYVVGELVKQRFLVTTGYSEGGQSTGTIVNFSRGLMAVYAVFAVLMLIG